MPRATAISISQLQILFSVKYHECFFRKKLPQRVMPFLFCFPISFPFLFIWARNFTVGRTSPANILMKKHHPITSRPFDHMTFHRLIDYLFTANRRSFHTIISRYGWEKKANWKESLRSFFVKNPGKLNNRLCLATVSLDCISNDFVSLSHCAPTIMAKQWSVVCVIFFPFHHISFSSVRKSIKDRQ